MTGTVLAVVALAVVALWLIAGAGVALLTRDRARRPMTAGESLTLAGVRLGMALAVVLLAVWVVTTR